MVFDFVSRVEEATEAITLSAFVSYSTKILFLATYSYIKMTFSVPFTMKYPLGS